MAEVKITAPDVTKRWTVGHCCVVVSKLTDGTVTAYLDYMTGSQYMKAGYGNTDEQELREIAAALSAAAHEIKALGGVTKRTDDVVSSRVQ